MKKIRINELARELEVKPNIILDLLPELGVQEKKTHSSSVDEDVAILLKRKLNEDGDHSDRMDDGQRENVETIDTVDTQTERPEETVEAVKPAPAPPEAQPTPAPVAAGPVTPAPAAKKEDPPAAPAAVEEPKPAVSPTPAAAAPPAAPARPVSPLRPPLASGNRTPIRPAIQQQPQPPATATTNTTPAPPTAPVAPPPAATTAPATPSQPAPPTQAPPPPARPMGSTGPQRGAPIAPRPGQILSGPRQPLPPGVSEPPRTPISPGTPRPAPAAPSIPRPPMNRPAGPAPGTPIARPTPPPPAPPASQTNQPPQQQAGPRPNIVGQPAARPVVPPRPDLVEKLRQQQKAAPGAPAPAAPRPGMPSRPAATPTPGQPIYRGPIRPGQTIPGRPAPAGPGGYQQRGGGGGRPGGGRPMHPTSPMRIEPAGPPPTDARRDPRKGGARPAVDREREMERQERNFRLPSHRRQEQFVPPPIDREITISDGITVKELSEKLGVKSVLVMKKLMERKIFVTINQTLDTKMAEELARDFGASTNKVSFEEETIQEAAAAEENKDLVRRAPVVTIMGHVDHGKTSLLDAIRSTNVAAREAGGITQHIGAYHVEKNGRKIVFIDTPGHEAFTRMRARGAKVTDIVILVVSADDGVMPQTVEAINHAKAANVPIIVAINKMDKPDAQPERIKQQLADRNLLAEDWGGDTIMVPVSARTQMNLDLLLEMVLLVADLQDLKANPTRPALGNVLEAKLDRGRGPVATVLVRNGMLRVGDFFICGAVFGKVRAMFDDRGNPVREAEPSMPVEVLGLDSLPEVGDSFQVVTDTAKAKQIVIYREAKLRDQAMARGARVTLDMLSQSLKEGETKELLIVLKADVGGTVEVLTDTLQRLSNDKVKIRVLSSGVGAITESDVLLASASNAIIVGFNVRPERNAVATAEQEKVDIRLHSIIYDLTDEIKRAMTGLLEPVFKEVYKGRAQVRDVFRITKVGTVAGCMVIDGVLTRNSDVRLLRDNVVIHTGKIDTLKRFKDDASEVKQGFECGVAIANYNDLKPGDIIEAFVTERVAAEALV